MGVGAVGPVADHAAAGRPGHVDHGREVDVDAERLHGLTLGGRQRLDVGGRQRRRLRPRAGHHADQALQPLHPPAFLVDGDQRWHRRLGPERGEPAVAEQLVPLAEGEHPRRRLGPDEHGGRVLDGRSLDADQDELGQPLPDRPRRRSPQGPGSVVVVVGGTVVGGRVEAAVAASGGGTVAAGPDRFDDPSPPAPPEEPHAPSTSTQRAEHPDDASRHGRWAVTSQAAPAMRT